MNDGPVTVVVGNPQPGSRTRRAAELVAARLATLIDDRRPPAVIDLAEIGPPLLGWGDPLVAELKAQVGAARALVVASPTYKATYTGLLKLFLDQFDHDELGGRTTVAMMTGGAPNHSLAVAVHLTPVLVEIGASCPARGIYLAGPEIDDPAPGITRWFAVAEGVLVKALAIDAPAPTGDRGPSR